MDPYERSTLELMSIIVRNEEKEKINSFPYTSKTHLTLKEKKFIPLYTKDLHFLITRVQVGLSHKSMNMSLLSSPNSKKISL